LNVELLPARFAPAAAEAAATTTVATAAAITTTAPEPLSAPNLRTRFVDGNPATVNFGVVELVDGGLRRVFRFHFDKSKPARAARRLVAHHANGRYGTRLGEQLFESALLRVVRKVADEQFAIHFPLPLPFT
jgi:hypothetical protein